MQAESALESIHVEGSLAEDLGESPSGQAAVQLHRPQAVLGVTETLAEVRVERVARADVRDAPTITHDFDWRVQACKSQLAVQGRQWSAQEIPEGARGQRASRPRRYTQAVEAEWHYGAVIRRRRR